MSLVISYTLFAIVATVANIAAQDIFLVLFSEDLSPTPLLLFASVAVGTLVGLVVKYLLDKRYIFRYRTAGLGQEGKIFILYVAMGAVTTLIFWGFEFGFHFVFDDKLMRYLGGVIGLAIGYWIKYQLDKRYVFVSKEIEC